MPSKHTEEKLFSQFLWVLEKIKQLKFVLLGLVICNLPYVLDNLPFIEKALGGEDFVGGFLSGAFAGLKIVGVAVFAYGFVYYVKQAKQGSGQD